MNQFHIIHKLRELPKHGLAKKVFDKDDFKAFEDFLDATNLTKQIDLLNTLTDAIQKAAATISTLEARALGLSDAFNTNIDDAVIYAKAIDKISKNYNVNARLAKQYTSQLNKLLPGQIKNITAAENYNTALTITNDIIRNRLKLDEKQNINIRRFATVSKQTTTDLLIQAEKAAKTIEGYEGSFVDILREVGEIGGEAAALYGRKGLTPALAQSVIQAKKLGITLDDLYKTGQKMLDVEQQTTAAVEFQIFSGKRLATTKYKNLAAAYNQATIEGDALEQTKILTSLVEEQGDLLLDNFKARQAAASALNMDEQTLYNMITAQRSLNELDNQSLKTDKEKKEEIKKLKKLQTDIAELDKRSSQERIQDEGEIAKAKVATANIDTPESAEIVSAAKKTETAVVGAITTKTGEVVTKLISLAGTTNTLGDILGKFTSDLLNFGDVYSEEADIKKSNDLILTPTPGPGYGTRVISAPEGTFALNNADTIVAGTNLGGGGGNNIGQQVAAALNGMTLHVTNNFDVDKFMTQVEIIQSNRMNVG